MASPSAPRRRTSRPAGGETRVSEGDRAGRLRHGGSASWVTNHSPALHSGEQGTWMVTPGNATAWGTKLGVAEEGRKKVEKVGLAAACRSR